MIIQILKIFNPFFELNTVYQIMIQDFDKFLIVAGANHTFSIKLMLRKLLFKASYYKKDEHKYINNLLENKFDKLQYIRSLLLK